MGVTTVTLDLDTERPDLFSELQKSLCSILVTAYAWRAEPAGHWRDLYNVTRSLFPHE